MSQKRVSQHHEKVIRKFREMQPELIPHYTINPNANTAEIQTTLTDIHNGLIRFFELINKLEVDVKKIMLEIENKIKIQLPLLSGRPHHLNTLGFCEQALKNIPEMVNNPRLDEFLKFLEWADNNQFPVFKRPMICHSGIDIFHVKLPQKLTEIDFTKVFNSLPHIIQIHMKNKLTVIQKHRLYPGKKLKIPCISDDLRSISYGEIIGYTCDGSLVFKVHYFDQNRANTYTIILPTFAKNYSEVS